MLASGKECRSSRVDRPASQNTEAYYCSQVVKLSCITPEMGALSNHLQTGCKGPIHVSSSIAGWHAVYG